MYINKEQRLRLTLLGRAHILDWGGWDGMMSYYVVGWVGWVMITFLGIARILECGWWVGWVGGWGGFISSVK